MFNYYYLSFGIPRRVLMK